MRGIAWRDLLPMNRGEIAHEILIVTPWLASSILLYHLGLVPLGAVGSFFVFLTGLRLSHGCQHYQLPIGRHWQDKTLFVLSAVMLTSMHAVQATHLNHHRHCLDDQDFEGRIARRPLWLALLTCPLFPVRLHLEAVRLARPDKRRWIFGEIATVFIIIAVVPWLPAALQWHVLAMLVGECFVGFFAVWTVHHGCDEHVPYRTLRSRWLNRLFYNMFLHTEHHLFPAVPTCHLHRLAERIDRASDAYQKVLVFPTRLKEKGA
ncbi:MAG: fatty acid desaturase [Planctomycetota bacterium]